MAALHLCALLNFASLPSNLLRRLVLPEADVNRVPQRVVSRPCQVSNLSDKLRFNPVHPRKNERRAEAGLARRRDAQRRCPAGKWFEAEPRSASTLTGIPVPTRPA